MFRNQLLALLIATIPALTLAQPIPVPGTEMVPNEYGSTFPREITWEKDGSRMILIPYGTFTQGLDRSRGGTPQESPERQVTLPSFYIDKYEVTNEKYLNFQRQSAAPLPRPSGESGQLRLNLPVTGIDWNAADQFAGWAMKELPTEAMWERAARGPANSVFTTGDHPPAPDVAIHGRLLTAAPEPAQAETGDISGFGVYHMGGNVAEFVRDYYSSNPYSSGDAINPTGPPPAESKVVRGAHFATRAAEIRTTRRTPIPRTQISDYIGFRTVWVPEMRTPEEIAAATPEPTPTPGREVVLEAMAAGLTPFLEQDALTLPRHMLAGRSLTAKGNDTVQFVNFTPFQLYLTFVSVEHERVFRYREPVVQMTYRGIELPREVDLTVLAYTKDGTVNRILNLGTVRAESQATVVLNTEMFGPVVTAEGERLLFEDKIPARQLYDRHSPKWNEVEIYNSFAEPVVLIFEDIIRDAADPQPVGEFTLDGRETLRLTLPPSRYRIGAEYIGALGESSSPVSLMLDDRVSRRLLYLRPHQQLKVVVITEERPQIELQLIEASRIR